MDGKEPSSERGAGVTPSARETSLLGKKEKQLIIQSVSSLPWKFPA